jgi:hypothetical protein
MAALSVTANNVKPGAGAVIEHGTAAVAVTAGQAVYLEASSGKYKLTDADSATAEARTVRGIALHGAAVDQPLSIQTDGLITIGATVAPGVPYFSSATAGGIAPAADNTTGVYPTFIGFGVNTTQIDLNFVAAGVAV